MNALQKVAQGMLDKARLPERYELALRALEKCEQVDECKEWSNRMAALASYARQARDSTLQDLATRIRVRAELRGGELLKELEVKEGRPWPENNRTHAGPVTTPSRSQAAEAMGLTRRERKDWVALASIPKAELDGYIERPNPLSTRQILEERARVARTFEGRDPQYHKESMALYTGLSSALEYLDKLDISNALRGATAKELAHFVEQAKHLGEICCTIMELAVELEGA